MNKEERKAEFLRLMELASDLECAFLAGNPDGMKIEARQASILHTKEGQVLLDEPISFIHIHTGICICAHCEGWWHEGELPKHDTDCTRPITST